MVLTLDKFIENWDASARPYWKVNDGHGAKGALIASNLENENKDESKEMLIHYLTSAESGKVTVSTLSSPHANNTFKQKVAWGDVKTSSGMNYGGGGNNMNAQLMMFMMQQAQNQNNLMMQMMSKGRDDIQAMRDNNFELQMAAIQREHEVFKEKQAIEAENGGSPYEEAMYQIAGVAAPLAQGLVSKIMGIPAASLVNMSAPAAALGTAQTVAGELGKKGGTATPEASQEVAGAPVARPFSLDKLNHDCAGITRHFPNVHPNDVFLMMRMYLEQNPQMAAMLLSQIQTAVPAPVAKNEDDESSS